MNIHLLFAISNPHCIETMRSLFDAALEMVPFDVVSAYVTSEGDLFERMHTNLDDAVVIDWDLVGDRTPELVNEIARVNTHVRSFALLPLHYRQYRQSLWEAGACSSIPKEHLDQEWLATVLSMLHRGLEREARASALALAEGGLGSAAVHLMITGGPIK